MLESLKDPLMGNLVSVMGLIVSIVGFILTIIVALKSKKAAEAAKASAETTKARILKTDSVIECANAITNLEEVRRLYRANAIQIIPDRLTSAKCSIVTVKVSMPQLTDQHQIRLQSAIAQIATCENLIEAALSSPSKSSDLSRLLKTTSQLIELLTESLIVIKNAQE